jgi:hypothetical protein
MAEGRLAVPAALKRKLFEEAGYRCAIPTCRGTEALEMAHVTPWSQDQQHLFSNMIVLCSVDHYRFDQGKIPRASIEVFKQNMALTNGRYGDVERRILDMFVQVEEDISRIKFEVPSGIQFLFMYLLRDGLITVHETEVRLMFVPASGLPATVRLTEKGIDFVQRLREAEPVL